MTINVLLIGESPANRDTLARLLATASDMRVQNASVNPLATPEKLRVDWPDVILIDLDQARMDIIGHIKSIMRTRPTPIVVCASPGRSTTLSIPLEAMSAGAVAMVTKPSGYLQTVQNDFGKRVIHEIHVAMQSRVGSRFQSERTQSLAATTSKNIAERASGPVINADIMLPPPNRAAAAALLKTAQIVAIGTSAGGTQALEKLLSRLPVNCPPIAIVQHMPESLTATFARRLDGLSRIDVREAHDGDAMKPGLALIAPGGKHMMIRRNGTSYHVEVRPGPIVNRHRPSVDVLFRSAATAAGINVVGFILTGMGDDGARGLKEMRDCGAHTVAQDEASCTVFGMPKEAIRYGAAVEVLSLDQITQKISAMAQADKTHP
ncbi:MAG TPA: chemotaxis-specific protein-glutamate methyltransferase CheB [Rhodocyclaceae bacterium]|nr:chemotaxis-specific protein-glutamate methyltransferase CheB [Rhodocyclaceae bacterium]